MSAPVRTIEVQEWSFRVTLPGEWERLPSVDASSWQFRSRNRESLSVRTLGWKAAPGKQQREETFRRLVESIASSPPKAMKVPFVNHTTPYFVEHNGVMAARYEGIEPTSQVHFTQVFLAGSETCTSFFFEAAGMAKEEFQTRARAILNSVALSRANDAIM
jgi:hypothetical protein